jgi:guanylate kinase
MICDTGGHVDASRGEFLVVASPSGGGKTTLIRRVIAELERQGRQAHFSVSHTTRSPRPGERDGADYHFVDRATFVTMIAAGEFLEHAEVHGQLYGTARSQVEGRIESGCDVFLDIDVQGARQVRAAFPDAVKVFVFPPSRAELQRRLVARRQDDEAAIALRMHNAFAEMREFAEFDFVIINACLDDAAQALTSIVAAARLRPARMRAQVQAIIEQFERAAKEG